MKVNTVEDLGNLVRERRLELGWSQADLALRAGVDRGWLGSVENGHPRAELGKLLQVVRTLDLVLDLSDRPSAPRNLVEEMLARHAAGGH